MHEASVRTAVRTLQTVRLGTVHTTSQGQTITTPAIASTAAVAPEVLVLVQRTERRHRSAGRSAARGMQLLGNILRMGSMAHVELSMRGRCNLEVCLLAPLTAPRRDPSDFHNRNVMTLCVCSQRPPPTATSTCSDGQRNGDEMGVRKKLSPPYRGLRGPPT